MPSSGALAGCCAFLVLLGHQMGRRAFAAAAILGAFFLASRVGLNSDLIGDILGTLTLLFLLLSMSTLLNLASRPDSLRRPRDVAWFLLGVFWFVFGVMFAALNVLGSGNLDQLNSVLDIFFNEGSTRQALESEYAQLLDKYARQVSTIDDKRQTLLRLCKEFTDLNRHRNLGQWRPLKPLREYLSVHRDEKWQQPSAFTRLYRLRDLKVVWLQQQIGSIRLALEANEDNINGLAEEIKAVEGRITLSEEILEPQYNSQLSLNKSGRRSFFDGPASRRRGHAAAHPIDSTSYFYPESRFTMNARGFAPRVPKQLRELPLHAAEAAGHVTCAKAMPEYTYTAQPWFTPALPAQHSAAQDEAIIDGPLAGTDNARSPDNGLSLQASALSIGPPSASAEQDCLGGMTPVRRLARQFAARSPRLLLARFGFAASTLVPAPVTKAVPLSLEAPVATLPTASAQASVVPVSPPAPVIPTVIATTAAPATSPKPIAAPPLETPAPMSTSASATVSVVADPAPAQAMDKVKTAPVIILPPVSQPRTSSKVAKTQNADNAAPSLPRTPPKAATQQGTQHAPPKAPSKPRQTGVFIPRKVKKPSNASKPKPNDRAVRNSGPANSSNSPAVFTFGSNAAAPLGNVAKPTDTTVKTVPPPAAAVLPPAPPSPKALPEVVVAPQNSGPAAASPSSMEVTMQQDPAPTPARRTLPLRKSRGAKTASAASAPGADGGSGKTAVLSSGFTGKAVAGPPGQAAAAPVKTANPKPAANLATSYFGASSPTAKGKGKAVAPCVPSTPKVGVTTNQALIRFNWPISIVEFRSLIRTLVGDLGQRLKTEGFTGEEDFEKLQDFQTRINDSLDEHWTEQFIIRAGALTGGEDAGEWIALFFYEEDIGHLVKDKGSPLRNRLPGFGRREVRKMVLDFIHDWLNQRRISFPLGVDVDGYEGVD
ncbi:hypothetical protein B0T16DRAFT_394746 [Cercophora newfieldiana]|uniref:Uncharacterized protein n=1 Tax=Cercophora newfieldiana TaxID=92897 RepID=A0AA39XRK8_9PEZI|nr:hypothetical protein B0T16DRAFT_394746 [Cercophora newfieldiana]